MYEIKMERLRKGRVDGDVDMEEGMKTTRNKTRA